MQSPSYRGNHQWASFTQLQYAHIKFCAQRIYNQVCVSKKKCVLTYWFINVMALLILKWQVWADISIWINVNNKYCVFTEFIHDSMDVLHSNWVSVTCVSFGINTYNMHVLPFCCCNSIALALVLQFSNRLERHTPIASSAKWQNEINYVNHMKRKSCINCKYIINKLNIWSSCVRGRIKMENVKTIIISLILAQT